MKKIITAVLFSVLLIGIMFLTILPIKANGELEYQFVTQQSNVDGIADIGTHSSFSAQQAGPDLINDTLTEANTNTSILNNAENFVDNNSSNVDNHVGHGTSSNFTAQQDANVAYNDTLTEADTGVAESWVSPTGYTDPSSGWNNEANAYDENIATSSDSVGFTKGNNSTWLIFNFTSTRGSKIEYCVQSSSTYVTTMYIEIANATGSWTNVYAATPTYNSWQNLTFASANTATAMRYCFYNSKTGSQLTTYAYVNETDYLSDHVPNYELDYEFQWTTAAFSDGNEYLCIRTGKFAGSTAENIGVDVWTGSWASISNALTASSWNNISISAYLTSNTITFRFIGKIESSDTAQNTWQIECNLIHTWTDPTPNYQLDIEEQFTNCNYTRTNEELCIFTGPYSDSETLSVQWWNTTDTSWYNVTGLNSLTANAWNNVSVTTYLTSSAFTIRFLDSIQTIDTVQSTWQIDCVLLHTWNIFNLNLRVRDWDLTDNIQGAIVYKDSDTQISDANGWANWTGLNGTVQIKVSYYGFWVNGTFSITMDSNKTINVRCKLYDITVLVQEGVQNAYLASANVTVYNSTSVQGNKITSGLTGNNGQVQLLNLPNNTLTFTQYGGASYSLVIGNTTQLVTSENQTITLTADQNNVNTNNNYSIIITGGITIPLKGGFLKGRLKKKRRNK